MPELDAKKPPQDPPKGDDKEHMIPKSRLDDEIRKTREAEERAAKLQEQLDADVEAKRKADEERQAKQGEFEQLARTREAERDDLKGKYETAKDRMKAINDRLHNAVDAEIKDWPEKLKAKIPARDAEKDAEVRAGKVDELRDLLPEFGSGEDTHERPPGSPRKPAPKGGANPAAELDAAKKRLRAGGGYSRY